jgi:sugar/nucleoside kinase (ribokinase family)
MMYDVTALGELLIDFVPVSTDADGYPTLAAKPGGAPANYLAALAVYGAKTAFLGKVGADMFGKLLIQTLKSAGIETKGILEDPTVFTTLAFVALDSGGNRSFSFARKPGADICIRFEELDLSLIDSSRVFHFGTLSLTDEPSRDTVRRAVEYARDGDKLITFDPNLRLQLWKSPEEAKLQMLWGLRHADIVKISDEEVRFLWGSGEDDGGDGESGHKNSPAGQQPEEKISREALSGVECARKAFHESGAKLVMLTMGRDGCVLINRNGLITAGTPPVQTVDTTGAGDIFGGSAVSRVLKLEKQPDELTVEELTKIASFAATAASLSTQKHGGIPSIPVEEEIEGAQRLMKKARG